MRERVVVTGMSINTPLGDTLGGYLEGLMTGRSAIRRWTAFSTDRVYSKIGGDLSDYDIAGKLRSLSGSLAPDVSKRMERLVKRVPWATKLSILSAADAYVNAGLGNADFDATKVATVVSGHNLNALYYWNNRDTFEDEPDFLDGLTSLYTLDTDHAGSVSEVLQLRGPIYTVGGACASGNLALRSALDEIRHHGMHAAFVVGAVVEFAPIDVHAMALMDAITYKSFNDQPERASRPYDMAREGFVPSHGGATLVLEPLSRALKRGAKIHAELLGVGATADGCHLPQPHEDGQTRAMAAALEDAGLAPRDVDYVNAHATSTPLGDLTELASIKGVFGAHAKRLKINAPKSMLGHTCWAAPTVETVAAILQMQQGRLHRSINIDRLDPAVDLDVCHEGPADVSIKVFMKNSFGFGGINCSSVYRRFEG
jgi:3-oxoacyl-[acyl-carrier-protein] synthase I